MAEEIFLNIITRDRPELALITLELLYETADRQDSFIPTITIDSDQIDLYRPLQSKFKDLRTAVVEHTPGSLRNCYIKQLDLFLESKCCFLLGICDDLTAILKKWDKHLLTQKSLYPDDLYTLYSASNYCGRIPQVCAANYCIEKESPFTNLNHLNLKTFPNLSMDNPSDFDFLTLWGYAEPCPVFTRAFAKYVREAFVRSSCAVSIDIIVAALVQQLYRVSGESRNVLGWPDHIRFIDDKFTFNNFSKSTEKGIAFDTEMIKSLANNMAMEILLFKDKNRQLKALNPM